MSNVDISKTTVTATVDVQSAWLSKINWTQAVGIGASVLVMATGGKVNIPLDQQLEIVGVIQGLQALATWAFKTFSKPSATPSQVKLHS